MDFEFRQCFPSHQHVMFSPSLFLCLGEQFRQPGALHLRVQHSQWQETSITDPDSSSHLLLPACVSHTSLCGRRRGWTRKPKDREAEQTHMGDPRGGYRKEAERGRQTCLPTSSLPLRAFPNITGGRPQPRPIWSHGNVDLRGGCGLQPGTLKHHQLGPSSLADRLAGPQRTLS